MKIKDILKKIGEVQGAIIENSSKLSENQINDLDSDINKLLDKISNEPSQRVKEKNRNFLTVKEVAKLFGKNQKTIYNWIKNGWIKSEKVGGEHVILRDNLFGCHFVQESPKALCIAKTIFCNSKKGELAIFEEGMLYDIVDKNEKWYYLFNELWDGTFRISKKQLKTNFSVEGEPKYEARKFNI